MLLSELTGIKNIKSLTPKELVNYLDNLEGTKLTKLGAGANGAAYTDGEKAFKFWHRDSGYERFIQYALKHQDNPHIPKLYGKVRTLPFEIETDGRQGNVKGLKYIKMELLKPLTARGILVLSEKGRKRLNLKKGEDEIIINNITAMIRRPDMGANLLYIIKYLMRKAGLEFNDADLNINPYDEDLTELESYFNPDVLTFFITLKEILSNKSFEDFDDVHSDNLAIRPSTGELVILDPIASPNDLDINSALWKT